MNNITVRIKRGEAFQEYSVAADENMSVMDVLETIYETQDNTLAFFRHEACHQEACGKCLVKVNGKVCLACGRPASEDVLVIEPFNGKVVRDLICEL